MIVTLNVFDIATPKIPRALFLMASLRNAAKEFPKANFTKLLGTSSAETFAPKDANWHRWAVLNVWPTFDTAAHAQDSPAFAKWQGIAERTARLWLRPISVKGSWGGSNPFTTWGDTSASSSRWAGPTVALTRARIRPNKWLEFWRSSPPVARELRHSPGLIAAMGIGEAPLGLQGTLSVWQTNKSLTEFVQRGFAHLDAIESARVRNWYSEDLFARFALVAASGRIGITELSSLHLPSSP